MAASCGLTSRYKDAQHAVYAKMLTKAEKIEINQSGEITKDILLEDTTAGRSEKGTLRVLKTDNPRVFNFVETGEWVSHGRVSGDVGKYHHPEFRDTTFHDNLGNSIYRVVYYGAGNNKFELGERWFSRRSPDSFIRHVTVFKNGVISSEYEVNIPDFKTPKSDRQKAALVIMRKEYSAGGELISTKTFED